MVRFTFFCFCFVACDTQAKPPETPPTENSVQISSEPFSTTTPDSAPSADETEQNKRKIESMIWRYKNPPDDIPACVDDKPNGSALFYDDGTLIHIPIPSQSPGIAQRHARSLRDDVVMIVYRPEDKTDTLSAVTTEDKGKTWEFSSIPVEQLDQYDHYYLSFLDKETGILILEDPEGKTHQVFKTENLGADWNFAASLSNLDALYDIHEGEKYCIAGEKDNKPVLLKSGDGSDWDEVTLPFDPDQYSKEYCVYGRLEDNIGLAIVIGITPEMDTNWLYYSSVDHGESWELYKKEG